ncbi:MAG: NlpC/P60 family protein [Oscillospiraceae bacterium]
MIKQPLKTLAITAVLTAAMTISANAASSGGATVATNALNLRNAPSTSAAIMTVAPSGSLVVVGGKVNDEWYKVVYRGATGYMSSRYLNYSEVMDGDLGFGIVRGSDVLIRATPDFSAAVVGSHQNGTRVNILGVYGSWYKVLCGSTVGFIHSDYIALNGGVADDFSSEASAAGQVIVDTAMKYMGVPYVWGGTSASGFDCSGLVYYVYKECGYTINRTAASIYQNGYAVDRASLKVGDAICFSSSSSYIGHVGIYIGDGQFIHASSGSGKVIISDLDSNYYNTHYVGARRIV